MKRESRKDYRKAIGGKARAAALSAEERADIARKGAAARWNSEIPIAEFEGAFNIGASEIDAVVLADGRRIITQATFLRALGRSRSPKAGTGVLSTIEDRPFFLQAEVLDPFIGPELEKASTPVFYRTKNGGKGVGYDAELLPSVAEVYLKFRDSELTQQGKVPTKYSHIVTACDMLIRGLAHVGIIALVDEATGYQEVRDRLALQAILDTFLAKELAAWAKRFPDEFYKEIFRLRGWIWKGMKVNKPQVVASYTKDIVYERLLPGLLEELEKKNPKMDTGRRRNKHHQWLTADVGHPALAQHLFGVITLMKASKSWDDFKLMLDQALPKRNTTPMLGFTE